MLREYFTFAKYSQVSNGKARYSHGLDDDLEGEKVRNSPKGTCLEFALHNGADEDTHKPCLARTVHSFTRGVVNSQSIKYVSIEHECVHLYVA